MKIIKSFLKAIGWIVLMFIALFLLSFLGRSSPVQIKLINSSTYVLNDVKLEGNGFNTEFSELGATSFLSFHVHPKGESGAILTFQIDGKVYQRDDFIYMEPNSGYYLTITIQTNLDITGEIDINR